VSKNWTLMCNWAVSKNWAMVFLPFVGIIIFYELWVQGPVPPQGSNTSSSLPPPMLIFRPAGQYNPISPQAGTLPPPATSFMHSGLQPFTIYQYQVFCENSQGKASGPWTPGRTAETCKCTCFKNGPFLVISLLLNMCVHVEWCRCGMQCVVFNFILVPDSG